MDRGWVGGSGLIGQAKALLWTTCEQCGIVKTRSGTRQHNSRHYPTDIPISG
jgi:hypothetical protein